MSALQFYQINDYNEFPSQLRQTARQIMDHPPTHVKKFYAEKPTPGCPIALLAAGIIVMVGALFILLAVNQILPGHPNVISQSGEVWKGIAYGSIALGIALPCVGLMKVLVSAYKRFNWEQIAYKVTMADLVGKTLERGEIFVMDDQIDQNLLVCYHYDAESPPTISKVDYSSPQEAHSKYITFIQNNNLLNKELVSCNTLAVRYPFRTPVHHY